MPLYTYTCDGHGEFAAWATMSESDAPRPCPGCEEPAPRALARPAVGGRAGGGEEAACGTGACAAGAAEMPSAGGCCGGGACMH
jgi:putative FmdB family regulatory protein